MDWSSSKRLRIQGYTQKTDRELSCTGERYRCPCRCCKFYRHEHWGLRPLCSSDEPSSEEEDRDEGFMSSRHFHWEYLRARSASRRKSALSHTKQDFARRMFSMDDDLSKYNEEGDNRHLTEGYPYQEGLQTWNRYQPIASSVHIKAGQTIPQHGLHDDLLYKAIQARCDRILDLLDPHHSRLRKEGPCSINPQDRKEEHWVWAEKEDTGNGVRSEVIHGGHMDREMRNSDEIDETGVDIAMEVDNLGCEEADGNQDVYQEMDDTFLVEEDWVDREQVTQGKDEFWWDNENLEEEMETQTMIHMKASFQPGNRTDSHGSEQEMLLQEWYEIEELFGKEGKPLCTAEDAIGHRQRQTLLAKWSLIEAELEAENVFSQHAEMYSRNDSEIMATKLRGIINKARLDIQAVVKIALQDITDIQETHISSPDQIKGFSPGNACVTEGQLVQVMERPLMKCQCDQFPWKPVHNRPQIWFDEYHREVRRTSSCTDIDTEEGRDSDGLMKLLNAFEDALSTTDPTYSTESVEQCAICSIDSVYQGTIAGGTSDANQQSWSRSVFSSRAMQLTVARHLKPEYQPDAWWFGTRWCPAALGCLSSILYFTF